MSTEHHNNQLPDGSVLHVTDRLQLRLFRPDDLPQLAALNGDPVVMEYLGGVMTRQRSDEEAHDIQESYRRNGFGKVAVERTDDGLLLGTCGLSREHWYPDDLEIGWRLSRPYWGHGYATEAAAVWLRYAFTDLGAERVISITDTPNLRSRAVMQRLGLTLDHHADLAEEDGSTFEAVVYAITVEEWQAAFPPTSRTPAGTQPAADSTNA